MNQIYSMLHLNDFTLRSLIDIIILAVLIYQLLILIRGTRSAQMLIGIVIMVVAFFITGVGPLELKTTHNVLGYVLFYIPFAVIVLFQNPIRRALISLGRYPFSQTLLFAEEKKSIDEIVLAAASMASKRIGALIVLERTVGLRNFSETGIALDANISYDLLMNIFSPATPLHDGAVIIGEGKIKAASCYLPLTLNPELSKDYGTRHRAGIGISEETDALAIIISEERGVISFTCEGRINEDLDAKGLKEILLEHFEPKTQKQEKKSEADLVEVGDED